MYKYIYIYVYNRALLNSFGRHIRALVTSNSHLAFCKYVWEYFGPDYSYKTKPLRRYLTQEVEFSAYEHEADAQEACSVAHECSFGTLCSSIMRTWSELKLCLPTDGPAASWRCGLQIPDTSWPTSSVYGSTEILLFWPMSGLDQRGKVLLLSIQ